MVYNNLKEYQDLFSKETYIINHIKCLLVREEEVNSFYLDGFLVEVMENSYGYDVYFDNYLMSIETSDKQIIDYKINIDR